MIVQQKRIQNISGLSAVIRKCLHISHKSCKFDVCNIVFAGYKYGVKNIKVYLTTILHIHNITFM